MNSRIYLSVLTVAAFSIGLTVVNKTKSATSSALAQEVAKAPVPAKGSAGDQAATKQPVRKNNSKSKKNPGIQASPAQMPLLKNWVSYLTKNEGLLSRPQVSSLTSEPIYALNLTEGSNDSIFGIMAKFYNDKKSAVVVLNASRNDTTFEKGYFFWDGRKLNHTERSVSEDGWLIPLESQGSPIGVGKRPTTKEERNPYVLPDLLTISYKSNDLVTTKLQQPPQELVPRQCYSVLDEKRKATVICDRLTGKIIAQVPDQVQPKTRGDFAARRDLDQRFVGGDLVVGGIETSPDEVQNMVWNTMSKDGIWKTQRLPLGEDYLNLLLPQFRDKWELLSLGNQRVRVWKDGSLIFLAYGEVREGDDTLTALCLIAQHPTGAPKLLSWELAHEFDPVGVEDEARENQSAANASRVFRHVWFPAGNGKIESQYLKMALRNDFIFDVDGANDAVIYLLGGRLWAIDMSKLRY